MKEDPKLVKLDGFVNKIHKMAAEDFLLELKRTADVKATELRQALEEVLGEGSKVRTIQHEVTFEIKDSKIAARPQRRPQ